MPVKWRANIVLIATAAFCHEGQPVEPHDVLYAWALDPGVVVPMVIAAVLYWRGATHEHGISRRERWCFQAGWWALFVALVSPVHPLGEALFAAQYGSARNPDGGCGSSAGCRTAAGGIPLGLAVFVAPCCRLALEVPLGGSGMVMAVASSECLVDPRCCALGLARAAGVRSNARERLRP
jgi:hypothetical protein